MKNCLGLEIDIACAGVYFFYAESIGMMKIGVSSNIARRFRELRRSCPVDLVVYQVIEGDARVEFHCHNALAEFRERGEWFRATPELLEHVRSYEAGGYFEVDQWSGRERPKPVTLEEWLAGVHPEGLLA